MKKVLSVMLCAILLLGIVSMCASAKSYRVGDILEFGAYPQSEVKDANLISALNAKIGTWKSYRYYASAGTDGNYGSGTMQPADVMQYADVDHNGARYRAVRFSAYRPPNTGNPWEDEPNWTNQEENGYVKNTVYWFKFEPIRWQVLDPASGFVMSETLLDAQPFMETFYKGEDGNYGCFGNPERTNYASDYANSSIRVWLNDVFLKTAFSQKQQSQIVPTALNNASALTEHSTQYDSKNTTDKVFLLSYSDIKNGDYGLSPDYDCEVSDDPELSTGGTAYAKCQGLGEWNTNSDWILRTALDTSLVCAVNGHACALNDSAPFVGNWYGCTLNSSDDISGIRPAIKLSSVTEIQTTTTTTKPVTTTEPTTEETVTEESETLAQNVSETAVGADVESSVTTEPNDNASESSSDGTAEMNKVVVCFLAVAAVVVIVALILFLVHRKKSK